MMSRCASQQSGFTLAETLVALFILAIVSSAGAALLISSTSASQYVRERENEARTLDIAQSLIRQDIAALSPRAVQPIDGFSPAGNLFGEAPRGEAPFLRFVRSGWINPASIEQRSTLQSVEYVLRGGALIRQASLRPDATRARRYRPGFFWRGFSGYSSALCAAINALISGSVMRSRELVYCRTLLKSRSRLKMAPACPSLL